MSNLTLLKAAMVAFVLGGTTAFVSDALAVNTEHPMNSDHSRANTSATVSNGADAGLSDTTAAAQSPDASPTGHAHRGMSSSADDAPKISPAPNPSTDKRGTDMEDTDHSMHAIVGSDGMRSR